MPVADYRFGKTNERLRGSTCGSGTGVRRIHAQKEIAPGKRENAEDAQGTVWNYANRRGHSAQNDHHIRQPLGTGQNGALVPVEGTNFRIAEPWEKENTTNAQRTTGTSISRRGAAAGKCGKNVAVRRSAFRVHAAFHMSFPDARIHSAEVASSFLKIT